MSYFTYVEVSNLYSNEWEELLLYICNDWPQEHSTRLSLLNHQIEAKALYVFTISKHLIENSENLPINGNWKRVVIEATLLLFPMIELVGQARLGNLNGNDFGSGLDWLANPAGFPQPISQDDLKVDNTRISTLGSYMSTLPEGPRVRELFHIRNYFVHGLKNQHDPDFGIGAVVTSMNYELPLAIIGQAKSALKLYWSQLQNIDGNESHEWVSRIAEADIYPFGIMGSTIYEKGIVDPDIIVWLSEL